MQKNRSSTEVELAPMSKLWWVVLLATAVATAANVIFYYGTTRLLDVGLMFPSQTPDTLTPMLVGDIILFSVIFALGAGVVFLPVTRSARRPIRTYLIIATAVLFLSLALPLKIPTPPVAMADKLSLVMMHVIGAIAVVAVLVGFGRK